MIRDYLRAFHLFSRDVRLYLVMVGLTGFAVFGGVYSVLLNLYLLRLGYGAEFIGLLAAVSSLVFAMFCLPAGAVGTRIGNRHGMITGLALLTVSYVLLPLVELLPAGLHTGWLMFTVCLANAGMALHIVNCNPYLMDVTGMEERNHAFSVQSAISPLAAFFGSLAGGFLPALFAVVLGAPLNGPIPYRYPLLIAGAVLFGALLAAAATRDVRREPVLAGAADAPASDSAGDPAQGARRASVGRSPLVIIILLAVVIFFQVAGEGVARTFFNVYLDAGLQTPTPQIGLLAALGQLMAVPAALGSALLMARWGLPRTYMLAALALGASMLPLALIPQLWAAGGGFMGAMMLAAIARTVISVFGMEAVEPHWRSALSGATTMAVGLSWGLMGYLGGYLIPTAGFTALFLLGGVLSAAGALLFAVLFGRRRRGTSGAPLPVRA